MLITYIKTNFQGTTQNGGERYIIRSKLSPYSVFTLVVSLKFFIRGLKEA